MKKLLIIILAILLVFSVFCFSSFAETSLCNTDSPATSLLRAGGGGSGNSGGSSSGGSGGSGHHGTTGGGSWLSDLITLIMLPFVFCSSVIVFYYKLSKRNRKSRKLIKQIQNSDNAWKFSDIQKIVEESFYTIQNAWSQLDMTPAKQYMSQELFESFSIKLNWMKLRKEKNILENISLIKALPVAVYDDKDNNRDHIWFYIKGRMVDYTVDTETMIKINGNTTATNFVEYWQFIRKDDNWVLNKILQKNEEDKIAFTE